jgi:hypothetical protein
MSEWDEASALEANVVFAWYEDVAHDPAWYAHFGIVAGLARHWPWLKPGEANGFADSSAVVALEFHV